MKLGKLLEILKDHSKEHRLYDSDNPEFYLNEIQYRKEEEEI